MLKNTNKTKDTGTNFDLKIDSLIEKKTISMKSKICVCQLAFKFLPKNDT